MPTTPADLILRDAPVYDRGSWAGDAIAVANGTILGRGSFEDMAPFITPDTEVRSLAGRWLLPGFHDAHVHPVAGGLEMNQCSLTGTTDIGEYLTRIRAYADAHPDRPWITGAGWSMDSFPNGLPTAATLDVVVPDRPVYLPNRDHHSAWVNSCALRAAGIDHTTPDPRDGRIERDTSGHPTGALHEGAMAMVADLIPHPSGEEMLEGLLAAQHYLHSTGIVGWQDALVGSGLGMSDSLPTYIEAKRRGVLTGKPVLALWWDRERGLEQLPDLLARRHLAHQAGLRASSVKIMQDGVCETHTAALLDSYVDADGHATGSRGVSFIAADDLAEYVVALDAKDFQVHIHALGDRAVRDSLDAIATARARNGDRGNRHHLAHIQVVHPDDVPRFAHLDVVANAQPLWACRDEAMQELTLPFLPASARSQQYVFGSLRRSGARLAFGSDWPVSGAEPLAGIQVAVTRRAPDADSDLKPLQVEESLGFEDALDAYTSGSAFVNRSEGDTGTLDVGYAADLVAVDADPLRCRPEDLHALTVTNTFVDGREVFAT